MSDEAVGRIVVVGVSGFLLLLSFVLANFVVVGGDFLDVWQALVSTILVVIGIVGLVFSIFARR
jgi:hypothetical protein